MEPVLQLQLTLTSNSYPAINDLSHDLGVSYSLINLTITVYLIFMGLAPTIVGSISDVAGRRPAYLICGNFSSRNCSYLGIPDLTQISLCLEH